MNSLLSSARFPAEVAGWGVRGVLCAGSSFWWAYASGFNATAEVAGMAAGVGGWVALFAGFSVWHGQGRDRHPERLVPALKIAAWVKFGLTAAGWAVFAASSLHRNPNSILGAGELLVMPDCLLGFAAIKLVSLLGGVDGIERLDSFGWTAAVTVVDGALFVLVIAAIATAVLLWWHFGTPVLARLKSSPARPAG